MLNHEFYELSNTEEFNTYLEALCHLASRYVERIRKQFAEKAVEMYHNETVRQIVLAYSEEYKKLEEDRLRDFRWVASRPENDYTLDDSCLNKSKSYADTIWFLFGIDK